LETLREFELTGDHKTDLDAIKLHIETWKNFGKCHFQEDILKGNSIKLDALLKIEFEKDTEMMRFANRMDHYQRYAQTG
jgi:hypothetical protein